MIPKFSEGLGGSLADQWIATVLTPAFGFWFGGFLAFIYRYGWASPAQWFSQYSDSKQLVILVLALVAVAASSQIVRRFDHSVIRWLEGYWPRWLDSVRLRAVERQNRRYEESDHRFQELDRIVRADIKNGRASDPEVLEEYSALDSSLRLFPLEAEQRMPTRLGNRLRAAERMSIAKYGLDAVVCWPRLWLLLPAAEQNEVTAAREELDAAARLCLWGLLFIVWTMWAWWALPVAILVILFSYRLMLNAAEGYGALIEGVFDLHRFHLYEALRWPLPQNPVEEPTHGKALTAYLWRGSDQATTIFTVPKK